MKNFLILCQFVLVLMALFYFVKFMLLNIEKQIKELKEENAKQRKQISGFHRRLNEIEKYGKN